MRVHIFLLMSLTGNLMACQAESEAADEECYDDADCPSGLECVISHDHPGDDHDHGGECLVPESE
tara:strand:+ start:202 stop:396 length:195 start_codon:yes stop_codon:yes gene_type:complete